MSDLSITTGDQRSTALAKEPAKRKQLGPKLRKVISLMVHEGMEMDKAARAANTSTRAIRKALERPHVLAYVKRTKEVFRASISSQNIFHAAKIRNKSGNAMAKLGAIKLLEGMSDEPNVTGTRSQAPGVVVVVVQPGAQAPEMHTVPTQSGTVIEHDQ